MAECELTRREVKKQLRPMGFMYSTDDRDDGVWATGHGIAVGVYMGMWRTMVGFRREQRRANFRLVPLAKAALAAVNATKGEEA